MISDVTPMHEPVVLEGDAGPIVAIVTELMVEPINVGVVLFSPGGYTISAQRNRWALGMAEQLAAAGLHTIRFDYHGIGDSAADLERFEQDRPLVGDGRAAIDELARRGVTDLILVGQCFGARTALAIAPDIAGLCGVFAISPSLRDLGRGEGTANRMAHDAAVGAYLKQAARVVEFSQLQDPDDSSVISPPGFDVHQGPMVEGHAPTAAGQTESNPVGELGSSEPADQSGRS